MIIDKEGKFWHGGRVVAGAGGWWGWLGVIGAVAASAAALVYPFGKHLLERWFDFKF